ncbi:MAG: hypothetical protein IT324_30000 [Anaerolineae bacterium]|nr:hypothetical protein [Anaerolineae bacterium]
MQVVSHIVMKDGEARIAGKEHLKAAMVARLHVDGEVSIEDVMAHYGLTAAEVHAALAYYYDNQAALDAAAAQVLAEIRENAMTLDKFKAKLASKPNEQ